MTAQHHRAVAPPHEKPKRRHNDQATALRRRSSIGKEQLGRHPDRVAESNGQLDDLWRAILGLRPEQRATFVLHELARTQPGKVPDRYELAPTRIVLTTR